VSEENKAVVRRLYEAWNAGDFATMEQLLSDDFVEHEQLPGMDGSKAAVIAFFKATSAAFGGFTVTPELVVGDGDLVSAFCTASGKHQGEFLGVPATGRQVSVSLSDYMRIKDGKATEHWGVMDAASLMQQLTG
jgi:steroid delta-isomerase-like uncharacterized protein